MGNGKTGENNDVMIIDLTEMGQDKAQGNGTGRPLYNIPVLLLLPALGENGVKRERG